MITGIIIIIITSLFLLIRWGVQAKFENFQQGLYIKKLERLITVLEGKDKANKELYCLIRRKISRLEFTVNHSEKMTRLHAYFEQRPDVLELFLELSNLKKANTHGQGN